MGAISRTVRLRSTRTITRFRTHRCKMIPRSARLRCRNSTRPYSRTSSRSEIMFPEIRTGTEISTIYGMSVTSAEVFPVIASSTAMEPTVCAPICQVMPGTTEIKESPVRINLIYTQVTTMVYRINRPEEIIQGHETQVFRTRQNPAKVIVPFIQITVISIHRRCPRISQVVDIRSIPHRKSKFTSYRSSYWYWFRFSSKAIRSVRKRACTRISPKPEALAGSTIQQSPITSHTIRFLLLISLGFNRLGKWSFLLSRYKNRRIKILLQQKPPILQ